MDLIKWTKNIKPKFPNVVEKFFGKKLTTRPRVRKKSPAYPQ